VVNVVNYYIIRKIKAKDKYFKNMFNNIVNVSTYKVIFSSFNNMYK
jgi:hypothetical protein